MTDRNLLRAQLLIEAADLLDEGYNKPNTNDKIESKRMRDAYNKAQSDIDDAVKTGKLNVAQYEYLQNRMFGTRHKINEGDTFNPRFIAKTRASRDQNMRDRYQEARDGLKNVYDKVSNLKK